MLTNFVVTNFEFLFKVSHLQADKWTFEFSVNQVVTQSKKSRLHFYFH